MSTIPTPCYNPRPNPTSQSVLCVICSSSQILASYPGHMGGGKVLLFFPCVAWVQGYTNTLNRGEHHWKKAILRTSLWWSVHVPDNLLNLLLPLGVYALSVLWSHEHGSKAEGRPLESWPVTLNHSGSEDGHNVCRRTGKELHWSGSRADVSHRMWNIEHAII